MKEYARLFWTFFKTGLFTIGGGMAMLPLIENAVVEKRKWMTKEEMVDCLAISQALPGAVAINSATYIGNHRKGVRGAIAATLGVVTPSFVIIILVVVLLGAIGTNHYVEGAFAGVKAAVCGLIAVAVYRLGKQVLTGPFQWVVAVLAFLAIAVFRVNAVWAVIGGALLGIIFMAIQIKKGGSK